MTADAEDVLSFELVSKDNFRAAQRSAPAAKLAQEAE